MGTGDAMEGRVVAVDGPEPLRSTVVGALESAGATVTAMDGIAVTDAVLILAGPVKAGSFSETNEAAWDELAEAPPRRLLLQLQQLRQSIASGSIVIVVPAVILEGSAGLVAATTGWEAARQLAKSAARRWGHTGLHINIVAVPLAVFGIDPPADALRTEPTTDVRHRSDTAVAETVVWVLGASHLNGETIQVDGGALMLP
jgi:NAD(P)-dependent dehydrogenase (short-subunit alcohol dehydrogenase family)